MNNIELAVLVLLGEREILYILTISVNMQGFLTHLVFSWAIWMRKKSLKTRGKTEKRLPEVVISIGALVSRCHSYHSSPRSRRSVPRGYEDDIVGFQPDPLIVRRVAP